MLNMLWWHKGFEIQDADNDGLVSIRLEGMGYGDYISTTCTKFEINTAIGMIRPVNS